MADAEPPASAQPPPARSGWRGWRGRGRRRRRVFHVERGLESGSGAFRCVNCVEEDHRHPIYSVQFNTVDLRHKDLFATCGSARVSVYRNNADGSVEPLQHYTDENSKEEFFTLAWSADEKTGAPLVIAAGQLGIIKIIDLGSRSMRSALVGHGNAVNDLHTHPKCPSLLFSASKDESVRLWNIRTGVCVAVFAGERGHRDAILSIDVDYAAERMVSAGMDHCIKIWDLTSPSLVAAIEASHSVGARRFPTDYVQMPSFSTSKIHDNYVDCVRFYGDLLLSKSINSRIMMWRPRIDRGTKTEAVLRMRELVFSDCGIWFIRFGLDMRQTTLACGNKSGTIYVWSFTENGPGEPVRLSHKRCVAVIRQVALNYDGSTILGVSDAAHIWRWDNLNLSKGERPTEAQVGAPQSPRSEDESAPGDRAEHKQAHSAGSVVSELASDLSAAKPHQSALTEQQSRADKGKARPPDSAMRDEGDDTISAGNHADRATEVREEEEEEQQAAAAAAGEDGEEREAEEEDEAEALEVRDDEEEAESSGGKSANADPLAREEQQRPHAADRVAEQAQDGLADHLQAPAAPGVEPLRELQRAQRKRQRPEAGGGPP